jgi:protein SCO1/2
MKTLSTFLRACLLAFAIATPLFAQVPGDSIYRLNLALTDQDGRHFQLADRIGKPQLVSMFYTSCQFTCPLIVEALKKYQSTLTPQEREKLQVLLVSFDPKRDTPARLKQVQGQRNIDAANWTLATTESAGVRKLAAVLDIQYRELPSGDFSHASTIVLLSADGRVLARTQNVAQVDADFVRAIHDAIPAAH